MIFGILLDAAADVAAVGGKVAQSAANSGTADAAQQQGGGFMAGLVGMAPLIIMLLLLYLIMIRPQRKKEKELKAKIDAMVVGDKVVTIGGICGKVTKLKDDYVYIETGNVGTPDERSVIKFERSAIKTVETIHE